MDKKSIVKPFFIVLGLMLLTALALAFTVDVKLQDKPGIRMELPSHFDQWVGNELRFCHNKKCYSHTKSQGSYYLRDLVIPDVCPDCGEKLYTMSWAEYGVLPKDTEFVKSVYTNKVEKRIFASIVLSGRERNSIHRPERCLKGQGHSIMTEYILKVPLHGRNPLDVKIAMLERPYRTKDGMQTYYSYYAYWFVGQDRETSSHYARMFWLAWDRIFYSRSHRWAYIAISSEREATGKEYEKEIIGFIQKIYPYILLKESPLQPKKVNDQKEKDEK